MDVCSICLEKNGDDQTPCLEENSLEWEKYNVQQVIKTHMWWWSNKNTAGGSSWICLDCWKDLWNFHNFYLRIQKQHNQYKELIKFHSCSKINENVTASTALLPDNTIQSENSLTDLDGKVEPNEYPDENSLTDIDAKVETNEYMDSDENSFTDLDAKVKANESPEFAGNSLTDLDVKVEANANPISDKNLTPSQFTMDIKVEECEYPESAENVTMNEVNDMKVKDESYEYPASEKYENDKCLLYESKQSNSNIEMNENTSLRTTIVQSRFCPKNRSRMCNASLIIAKHYDEYIASNFVILCSLCRSESPFTDFYALKLHFQLEHSGTQAFVSCCGCRIRTRGMLVDHLQTHKDPEMFKCEICSKLFPHGQSLKQHMEYHAKERRVHECHLCRKTFSTQSDLKVHLLSHTNDKPHACPHCPRIFKRRGDLYNHTENKHPQIRKGPIKSILKKVSKIE